MAEIFDVMMMAKELGLTHIANGEVDLTDERVSNLDYLHSVFKQELEVRQREKAKRYTKRSRLPDRHYDYNYISSGLQWQLDRIKNFDFKTEHQNIIIIGKCCRGKTSLAVDISLEAIQKGAMVVYGRVTKIIQTCFLQADFRQSIVKILANPLGFAPFCALSCQKSPL